MRVETVPKGADGRGEDVLPLRPQFQPEERHEVGDISYTRTRVLPPAESVLRDNRIVSAIGRDAVADAYKIMCIQALQRLREREGNALAVVSPGPNEGKTLTAINLAMSLARKWIRRCFWLMRTCASLRFTVSSAMPRTSASATISWPMCPWSEC